MEETLYDTEVEEQQQPDPIPKPKKLKVKDFAAKIKAKYPDYKNVDDLELTNKIISKYPEYKEQVDLTPEVKKKVGSIGLDESSLQAGNSLSTGVGSDEIPKIEMYTTPNGELIEDPFALTEKYNSLKGATKKVPMPSSGKGGQLLTETPDEEKRKDAQGIKESLKVAGIDVDKFSKQIKDVPNELYNIPGFSKEEILQEINDNPQRAERRLATGKWQLGFKKELDNSDLSPEAKDNIWDSVLSIQNNSDIGNYDQQRRGVRELVNTINQYGGENKSKLLRDLAIDRAKTYGKAFDNKFSETAKEDKKSEFLDDDQLLGMQYLEDTQPEVAKGYNAILIDPKKIEGNTFAKHGWEEKMLRITELGIGLQQSHLQEEMNDLQKIAKQQGEPTPEQVEKYSQLELKQQGLNAKLSEAKLKYWSPSYYDREMAAQELLGQKNTGGSYITSKIGQATTNTVEGLQDIAYETFASDEANKIHQLAAVGENMADEAYTYVTQKNSALQNFELKVKPELQQKIDLIKNDSNLSDEEKSDKVYDLLRDNPDEWGRLPIQGGRVNVSPSSMFYSVAGLGAMLVPFMAIEAATGGIGGTGTAGKLLRTFNASMAVSLHETYAAGIREGVPNPMGHAIRVTAINSAALAGAMTPQAIRAMLGTKTAIGELVSKMSDDAINAALKETPAALKKFGKSILGSFKTATKEGGKITAFTTGGEAINTAISGKDIDTEMLAKQALVSTLTFSLGGGLAGIKARYDKINNLQADALVRATTQPELFIEAANQQLKDGNLSVEQFNNIKNNIEKAAEVSKKVPFVGNDGKPLSVNNRAKLLMLKMQEAELKEATTGDVPPNLKEKNDLKLEELNTEIEEVYKNKESNPTPTDVKKENVEAYTVSGVEGGDVVKQIENFGVPKEDVEATHGLLNQVFSGLKKAGLTAAKTVGDWVGIGKGSEKPYSLKIGDKEVQVKDTQPEVVNGFYSPLEKVITESKFDKLPAKQWAEKYANSEEAKWTGLKDWLAQQQGSVSKAHIQQFLKDNKVSVVEVVRGTKQTPQDVKNVEPITDLQLRAEENGDWIQIHGRDNSRYPYDKRDGWTVEEAMKDAEEKMNDFYNAKFKVQFKDGTTETVEALNKEDAVNGALLRINESGKFSQYQLEGQKDNYKEVLVTLPNTKPLSFDEFRKEAQKQTALDDYEVKAAYKNYLAKGDFSKVLGTKFKSGHFEEPNILVHLRMNTRTDAEGNKVLFLEEVQSDWGQKGKKEGFNDIDWNEKIRNAEKSLSEIEGKLDNLYSKYGGGISRSEFRSKNKEFDEAAKLYKEKQRELSELTHKQGDNILKVPQAPFVTDTNAWTKLALKTALKEAVKQGADKISWTTGEQQNSRYDLSKQVDRIDVEKVEGQDNLFFVDITMPNGEVNYLEVENGKVRNENSVYKGQRLDDLIGKDMAEKILTGESQTIKGEGLKVGGKGMKGFYGSPTEGSLGIVGNVAKSLFKQEPKTTRIESTDKTIKDYELDGVGDGFRMYEKADYGTLKEIGVFKTREDAQDWINKNNTSTQHSIDITPEMKAEVEGKGQPLFKDAEAQYRIESGKNIIEAIKDFNQSKNKARATVALTHEIMHPTVVSIIDGAKEGNEIGTKHTETIVNEFNKANPNSKVTVEDLIKGNDAFKDGTTSKQYRQVQEFIAKAWEKYHTEGGKGFSESFQKVLDQITKAFQSVYKSITGKQLTPELKQMFDDILGKEQSTKVEEQTKQPVNEEVKIEIPKPQEEGGVATPEISEVALETKEGETGQPPKKPPIGTDADVYTEDKRTELSFRGLQEVATEFGLNDVTSRERKSDLQLFKDAETEIKKWVDEGFYQKNIETVIKDAAERKPISDTQRVILENHIHAERVKANEIAKQKGVNSKEFKDAVNEIDRITKAAITSRQEAGAALRIPTTANNNTASLADAIIATKESKNVSELTDTETAEVEKQYKAIEDANAKFQEYKAEAEAKFKEYQAKIEMLEAGKANPKGKKTSTDLKTERANIKKSIADKWKSAGQDILSSDIPYRKQLAAISPDVAKLMRNYYQDGVRQVGEMIDKIHEYLKDVGISIEKSDVQDLISGKYNEKKLTKNEMVAAIRELKTEAQLLNEYEALLKGEPPNEKAAIKRNKRLEELRKNIKSIKEIEKEVENIKEAARKSKGDAANKVSKDLDKAEKEIDLKEEKERKEKLAAAQKESNRLKREFEKEQRASEKESIKEQLRQSKEVERQLSYRTPIEKAVGDAINRNKKKEEKFKEKLAKGDFEKQPKHKTIYEAKEWQRQNPSLYKKLLDSQAKADQARADFEAGLIENEMKNAGLGDKFRSVAKKSSGTLKQLFASFDLSAIAVQNLPFILTQPKTSVKGLPKSFVHMASQKQFDRYLTELHNSSYWPIFKDMGLRVTEPKSLLEATREDYFPDRFKAVVKINGKEYGWVNIGGHKYELLDLSKPFERQFTSLGNLLRTVKATTEIDILKSKGITFENSPEEYKTLAKRLNNLTSSSDIPAAYQNEITRTLIWSSRLVAAKLNMLGISDVAALIPGTGVKKGYYRGLGVKGQKISRQQAMAAYDLAKFATSVVALTYLVALMKGGTVNTNPTSNQFMDVEYDDGKSMNLTGGFSSYIAKLFQFANWGKTDKYGVFKPYKGTDPIKESMAFMGSKAPPVTRSLENVVAGKDQFGQDADISTEASKYKMPLAIGQIYDQIQKDGVGALFTEGIPTLIGFNAKDNRNYNTHKFSNDTEKFIIENQVPISMPQKVYTKNGEKMEMTKDEYKDFLNQIDKEIDNITSDIKKNGGYVIRNKEIVQLPYSKLTKEEISEMTKEMITEATAQIRKDKFKTDEETDEYIEKSTIEEILRQTRKVQRQK